MKAIIKKTGHWILVVGGINLGLMGLGTLLGTDLNLIGMLLKGNFMAIWNILVGLSAGSLLIKIK